MSVASGSSLRLRPSPRLSSAGVASTSSSGVRSKIARPPHGPPHSNRRLSAVDMRPAGMPSWALDEGLDGHPGGPDQAFVGPEETTASRVFKHLGENGEGPTTSLYSENSDEAMMLRAARRQSRPDKRRFAKPRKVPEDECLVEDGRRRAQEDEWRRILRRARGAPSSVTTYVSTEASVLTAGVRSQDIVQRAEASRRISYGKKAGLMLGPGDGTGPPLPLGSDAPLDPVDEEDTWAAEHKYVSSKAAPVDPPTELDRLGRVLQVGTRPW